jgi:HAMP domain-containing protein
MRVNLRSFLLATNAAQKADARKEYDIDRAELDRLLTDYADKRSTSDKGRRFLNDFRTLSREWMTKAEEVMSLAAAGHQDQASALLLGPVAETGGRLSKISSEWIQYNENVARDAGQAALDAIGSARLNLLIAVGCALTLSGILGFVTFRRIVTPIRALQTSVESIAGGDYAKEVPFTKATDETGALARSVNVLKQGAAAMEEQRWVKSNVAKLTGDLQGATSLAEFGQRLISGLAPVLGGGVAGFYSLETNPTVCGECQPGLAEDSQVADSFWLGKGLVGGAGASVKPVVPPTCLPATRIALAWDGPPGSGRRVAAGVWKHAAGRDGIRLVSRAQEERAGAAGRAAARGGDESGDSPAQPAHAGTAGADPGTGPPA